jgi:hypothetical protein
LKHCTSPNNYVEGDDGTYFEDITGFLAHASMQDLQDKIVFLPYTAVRDWLEKIKLIQEAGAIAVLYGTDASKLMKDPAKITKETL